MTGSFNCYANYFWLAYFRSYHNYTEVKFNCFHNRTVGVSSDKHDKIISRVWSCVSLWWLCLHPTVCWPIFLFAMACQQIDIKQENSGYSLLGPAWKSVQRRICFNYLPWSMLFKIRCILLNERPRDNSLVPITWPNLPCLPEREWRVSLLFTLLRDNI